MTEHPGEVTLLDQAQHRDVEGNVAGAAELELGHENRVRYITRDVTSESDIDRSLDFADEVLVPRLAALPLGRLVQLEEVVQVALFRASIMSSYLSGVTSDTPCGGNV